MSDIPRDDSDVSTCPPPCRCRALLQHSWWHEVLENEGYQVERVDVVNRIAEVITVSVSPGPGSDQALFLTVPEVDWPALLANFAEPVVTRSGEHAAMLAHDQLLSRLRELLGIDGDHLTAAELTDSSTNRGRPPNVVQ